MYPVSPQAYDRAITVFSPDGRLFQVEYAKEAVRRGATAIGVICADAVILVAHKNIVSNLLVPESMKKIFRIDDHIAVTASGLVADARRLVDLARYEAQKHKLLYNESITVESVSRHLCDTMQIYTQYGGIRPFGVSLLIAGFDSAPRLYEAEPSGALTGYKAAAIGSGKKEVDEFFEKEYNEKLSFEDGVTLAIRALKKTTESKLKPENLDVAKIGKDRKVKLFSDEEVNRYLSKA